MTTKKLHPKQDPGAKVLNYTELEQKLGLTDETEDDFKELEKQLAGKQFGGECKSQAKVETKMKFREVVEVLEVPLKSYSVVEDKEVEVE